MIKEFVLQMNDEESKELEEYKHQMEEDKNRKLQELERQKELINREMNEQRARLAKLERANQELEWQDERNRKK